MSRFADNLYDVANFLTAYKLDCGTLNFNGTAAYLTIWTADNLDQSRLQALERAFGKLHVADHGWGKLSTILASDPIECGEHATIQLSIPAKYAWAPTPTNTKEP